MQRLRGVIAQEGKQLIIPPGKVYSGKGALGRGVGRPEKMASKGRTQCHT